MLYLIYSVKHVAQFGYYKFNKHLEYIARKHYVPI